MRCPPCVRASLLRAIFPLLALCTAAACSGGNPEGAGATGTGGEGVAAPVAITVSQTYITVENRTGAPLVGGNMEIIAGGAFQPFRTSLPFLEIGSKRDFTLNTFRSNDGTPFSRAITRARRVKITAKDRAGKVYEHEVPFN
jgi:hypothetical protein